MFAQHEVCVAHVHTLSVVPVLFQFSLECSQVTFLLMAKLRVRVSPSSLTGPWENRRRSVSEEDSGLGFVNDLSGPAVACHASLSCSFICSHLQADDIFAFAQLFVCEISPVLLGLPANTQVHNSQSTMPFLSPAMKPPLFYQLSTERLAHTWG